MSFSDHIRACNNYDPARVVPLTAGNARVGLLRRDNAEALRRFPDVFAAGKDNVELVARGDVAAVSRAVDAVIDALVSEGRVPKWRNETFDAAPRWGAPPVFRLDRGAVPFFGTRAYGVHLNGYLRQGETLCLWVGRRSPDKQVAPNKLDNLVAGGIGNGHGVDETLLKVFGHDCRRAHAGEKHAGRDESRNEKIHVAEAGQLNGPSEDVPEDK